MKNSLKKQMEVLSNLLKWGGIVVAIILFIVGYGIVNNVGDIKTLIASAMNSFGNNNVSNYVTNLIDSFSSLGWLVICIGFILGIISYAMSLILKGQILVIFNGENNTLNESSQSRTLDKFKNIYNVTKESLREENSKNLEKNKDLKI